MSIEDITVYADFEKWVKEMFPEKEFSNEEMGTLSGLVREAKKLYEVEKELKKNKEFSDFMMRLSDNHVGFYKDQLKSEQAKGKIENMVGDALKSEN